MTGEGTAALLRGVQHDAIESGIAGAAHDLELERAVAEADRDQPHIAREGRERRQRRRPIAGENAELDDVDPGRRHRLDGAPHRERRQRQVADGRAHRTPSGDGAEDVADDGIGEPPERARGGVLEVDDVGAAVERHQRFLGRAHAGEKPRHVRTPAVAAS